MLPPTMDQQLLQLKIDDADSLLQSIRSGFLIYITQGGSSQQLLEQLKAAAELHSLAEQLELADVAAGAGKLQVLLAQPISEGSELTDDRTRQILDQLSAIEEMIVANGFSAEEPLIDLSNFVDRSFDTLHLSETNQADHENSLVESGDEFEIDSEMLEIFAMEAEDLLRNIGTALDQLSSDPEDRDALWDIRRNAHTFKGAAGIVGLKAPSALAHRVEDLLDHLAENELPATAEIYDLLNATTECLKAITSGDMTAQGSDRIAALYLQFDRTMESLRSQSTGQTAGVAAAEPFTEDERSTSRSVPTRSIIRVSLSKLDDIAKVVRDLVVSRSVFEQRLNEFGQQIEDLHNSTRRLQSTSSQLEIDFETSMISTYARQYSSPAGSSLLAENFDQFDPLEFDRYTELHQRTRELAETTTDTYAIHNALDGIKENLGSLFETQRRLIEEMQEKLMRIRMVEFGSLTTRLHRAVRVTAEEEEKLTEVSVENQDQELDTQVLDALIEPLMHLLRNAVVHGIETPETRRLLGKPEAGQIRIRLLNEETHIVLKVSDDGRGIAASALKEKAILTGTISQQQADGMTDEDVLKLIFVPGLTTAERLSLSAGRGVGMSIVRESVESRGGTIDIETISQRGTTFTVRFPLPLAVTNVLHVRSGRSSYAVPVKLVRHIGDIEPAKISNSPEGDVAELITGKYPVKYLAEYTGWPRNERPAEYFTLLLIETSDLTCALMVDEIIKTEEVIIKPLGKPLDGTKGVLGAGVMANGETVPILDLPILLRSKIDPRPTGSAFAVAPEKLCVMVVDDSPSVRHMTSKIIENAGWKVVTAKDGIEALELLRSDTPRPAVILTDVEMPRMDGYELVSAVETDEKLNGIPLVFITSRSGEKHRDKAVALGITNYLTKPFDEKELVDTVKRLTLAS